MKRPPDSRPETWKHIHEVQKLMNTFITLLLDHAAEHDQSKLETPEVEQFDELTGRLKDLEYGSKEYQESLKALGPALEHHYAKNPHHPDHYEGGIKDMTLVDVIEMLCDWMAATMRQADGNIRKSLKLNKERFQMDEQLYQIFLNTIERLGW